MAEETNISWCDMTHNHWIGCARVSPACDGCYAAHLMETRMGRVEWGGPGKGAGTRSLTSEGNRRKPLTWNRKAEAADTRPFVFCSSLADVFDNKVPTEWRVDLFRLIRATPNLVWLLLTKRPQLITKLYDEAMVADVQWLGEAWPANAAIGTTVEDQERANLNVPALLEAKAKLSPAFAFLSCEPLLGPIDLTDMDPKGNFHPYGAHGWSAIWKDNHIGRPWIDWVIAGGETDQGGHKARPSNRRWFRTLRDQCAAAGVPFHFKQWGEFTPDDPAPDGSHTAMRRVGKHSAGRLLDGVEHNARPEVRT